MLDEAPLTSFGTWDATLLAPVAEINQQLLIALRSAALDANGARLPRLLTALREDWARLDQAALERLAACPYLLLDAGFSQPSCWERLSGTVMDAPAGSRYLPAADATALLRRALLLGWHLARANRLAARVLFGMSAAAVEWLGSRRLQELESLAERGVALLGPRWEQQPRVWQQLMRAAMRGPALQLRAAQLRGLQLMAASSAGCGGELGSC